MIEIIVALAILGVGLVAVIQLFSGGLRLGKTSEEYTKAVSYARMKLEQMALVEQMREGEEDGDFGEFGKDIRWHLAVKKVDLLPGDKGTEFKPPVEFYQIKLDVLWNSGMKERVTSLESYKTLKAEAIDKTQ